MSTFSQILGSAIVIVIALYVIISVILFIKDGIDSKKQGRVRNKIYTVMFIIGMVIVGLVVMVMILLIMLATLFMRSM